MCIQGQIMFYLLDGGTQEDLTEGACRGPTTDKTSSPGTLDLNLLSDDHFNLDYSIFEELFRTRLFQKALGDKS